MSNTGNTTAGSRAAEALSHRALAALVSQLTDAIPNPEDPNPPGPLDPYIRIALHQTRRSLDTDSPLLRLIAGRHPEATDAPRVGGGPILLAALNPQPLPPRGHFAITLARVFAERMTQAQEVADLMPTAGGERAIIIVGGRIAAVIDELCGTSLLIKWPFPWPPPPWFSERLDGTELMAMGLQFHQAAGETSNRKLAHLFAEAAGRLIETGAGRVR